ncbi:hypothetical protein D3C75_962180 [compost metagenome]
MLGPRDIPRLWYFTLGALELCSIRITRNQGDVLLFREYSGCSCSVSIRSVFNHVGSGGGDILVMKLEGNIRSGRCVTRESECVPAIADLICGRMNPAADAIIIIGAEGQPLQGYFYNRIGEFFTAEKIEADRRYCASRCKILRFAATAAIKSVD